MFSAEQLGKQAERTKSDAELIKKGAKFVQSENEAEPRLELGDDQIDQIKKDHKEDVKKENETKREKLEVEIMEEVAAILEKKKLPEYPDKKIDNFNTDPLYLSSDGLWLKNALIGREFDKKLGCNIYKGPRVFTTSEHGMENSPLKSDIISISFNNVGGEVKMPIRGIDLIEINSSQREEIVNAIVNAVQEEVDEYEAKKELK